MIEQCDKEIFQIHASPELIQRTKAAMQREENRIHHKGEKVKAGNRRVVSYEPAKDSLDKKRKSNI